MERFLLNAHSDLSSGARDLNLAIICIHTFGLQVAKALVRLRSCIGLPESWLLEYLIITKVSCAGPFLALQLYEDI